MIQQIYITDYLCDAARQPAGVIEQLTGQCPALLKADWQVISSAPLQILFSELQAARAATLNPASAVLMERQVWPAGKPALCLLPVHLNLQRDTFALQGTVRLHADIYAYLTQQLQQHFREDFIIDVDPGQRFWWIRPLRALDVQSPWPQDVLFQQALQWQPQGKDASLLRQWSNEIQMLLHQLAHQSGLPEWPTQLNSLWFASVPALPRWRDLNRRIYGGGALLEGLAACQLPSLQLVSMKKVFEDKAIKHALMIVDHAEEVDWSALAQAMQKGKVSKLELIIPFLERSVRITYRQRLRWQFWRKPYSLPALMQQLEAALPTARSPEQP